MPVPAAENEPVAAQDSARPAKMVGEDGALAPWKRSAAWALQVSSTAAEGEQALGHGDARLRLC